jgi:uncharacterized protein YjbI with pentapeptide repeats
MAETRIDPLDVGALEKSLNDSAGRVSGIWLSFVAFSAYLAAAASIISHRQLFLEDPIKLPTINIDLPLVASAILLPMLFVIYHIFVLLQVVLLSRTADAYNEAVERNVPEGPDRTLIRQRLGNTLFAQLFAGSPREREGVIGWLLRIMAWVTLALAPPLVLLIFELKFLPYHSGFITWTQRFLISFDLLTVLLLWAGAVDPRNDITWKRIVRAPVSSLLAVLVVAFSCIVLTFPGEFHAGWTRQKVVYDPTFLYGGDPECHEKGYLAWLLSLHYDRISVVGGQMIDGDKLRKIEDIAKARNQKPYEGERTRSFRGRDLRCGNLGGVDLRRADFTDANLSGANLAGADLQGSLFKSHGTQLQGASLDGALLQGANFEGANLKDASLAAAHLQNAVLNSARLQNSYLENADLTDAEINGAMLQGAFLRKAQMRNASLDGTHLEGANLERAQLPGASLAEAHLNRARLRWANLTGAHLQGAKLQGADLNSSTLRGANLSLAALGAADLRDADLDAADLTYAQLPGTLLEDARFHGASLYRASLIGASAKSAKFHGAILVETEMQGVDFDQAELDHALVERTFLWRSSLAKCAAAQVIEPRFEYALGVAFGTHTGTGETLLSAAPEAVTELIAETMKNLELLDDTERKQRRTKLEQRLGGDTKPEEADAMRKAWTDCAENSAAHKEKFNSERAAYLLKEFCDAGPEDLPAVEGLYQNWLRVSRWSSRDAKFDATMARGLLGLAGTPCPGGNGLSSEAKEELRQMLEP